MEEKKIKNYKKEILLACGISALLLTGFLVSFAFFNSLGTIKNEEIGVQAGTFALIFSDDQNGINEQLEFGRSIDKYFTIENTGTIDGTVSILWQDIINSYTKGSLTYTFEEINEDSSNTIISNKNLPKSSEPSEKLLASALIIPAITKKNYKLTITLNYLEDIDQTADFNAILSTKFNIVEGIVEDNFQEEVKTTLATLGVKVKESEPKFYETAGSDETKDGLYALEDDYGTSYYYRGAVENNYVKFAGFYWRIVRINGDGSLRIMYDGIWPYLNGINNNDEDVNKVRTAFKSPWNSVNNDNKYVGYMFGGSNGVASEKRIDLGMEGYNDSTNAINNETNSDIKIALENWYVENIKNKGLDKYVSDEVFCNDRTIIDNGPGTGVNSTYYGAYSRTYSNNNQPEELSEKIRPLFKCPNKNDAFTKSDTERGNGKLNEKIGLLTADEALAAGSGKKGSPNYNYYLYKGAINQWLFSPHEGYSSSSNYCINSNVNLSECVIKVSYYASPVINLSGEYVSTFVGDGTIGNEYHSPEKKTSPATINTLKTLKKSPKEGRPNFLNVATTDETIDGLYALEDDYGISYYYRGAVENNYVKFGKWNEDIYYGFYKETDTTRFKRYSSLEECTSATSYNKNCTKVEMTGKDMYWRIIRINGDGSVRMIYDGIEAYPNGTSDEFRVAWRNQKWNSTYNDNKHIGYMFGGLNDNASSKRILPGNTGYEDSTNAIKNETSSEIKTALETWYRTNIKGNNLDNYVQDAIFCNDRSIPTKLITGFTADTGKGFGTNETYFGPFTRSGYGGNSRVYPRFTCRDKNDTFTVSDTTYGNAALSEKIGLITLDEIIAAGSGTASTANSSYYLFKGYPYYSMSPFKNGTLFGVTATGSQYSISLASSNTSIVPVINLTPEYFQTLIGDGTTSSPYRRED